MQIASDVSSSLADPQGSSALVAATQWVEGTLLGTVATTLAVIAVASVGFLMLSGRLDIRRGLTVIVGCFVLFGASSIVEGITGAVESGGDVAQAYVGPPPVTVSTPSVSNKPSLPYDPYAGASVPPR